MGFLPPIKTKKTPVPPSQTSEPIVTEYNPAYGPLKGTTINYDLNLVNFDWITWHDYEHDNWITVDTLLHFALLNVGIYGTWQPYTDYTPGIIVINPDTTPRTLMQCLVEHTSTNDMQADIDAGYWNPNFDISDNYVQRTGDSMFGPLHMFREGVDPLEAWTVSQHTSIVAPHIASEANPHKVDYLQLASTPNAWPDVTGGKIMYPYVSEGNPSDLMFREIRQSDLIEVDRVRWRYPYVFGSEYKQHDMVLDYPWTMVANKDTFDRAAPQLTGSTVWSLPDVPAWTANETATGIIHSGVEFTVTQPIQLRGVAMWVPTLSTSTNYILWSYTYPEGRPEEIVVNQIGNPLLTEDEWATVSLSSYDVYSGTVVGFYIDALDIGDTIAPGGTPADWVRSANDNNVDPAAGNWNRSNDETILRIHEQTADAAAIDMLGTIAGSTITFTSTAEPQRFVTYTCVSDETATGILPNRVFSWTVEVDSTGALGAPAVNERTVCTFVIPQGATTQAKELTGSVTIPAWASTAKGLYREGGTEQPWDPAKEGNTYGIRLLTDTYTVSEDWDIVSRIGGSGGGGGDNGETPGGGASITVGDVFPDGADVNALHYLTAQPVGLYLKFDDGNTVQWINTDQAAYNSMAGQYLPLTDPLVTDAPYLQLSGGTMSGDITMSGLGGDHVISASPAGYLQFRDAQSGSLWEFIHKSIDEEDWTFDTVMRFENGVFVQNYARANGPDFNDLGYNVFSWASSGFNPPNNPTNAAGRWTGISINPGTNRGLQIAAREGAVAALYFRTMSTGTDAWGSWRTLTATVQATIERMNIPTVMGASGEPEAPDIIAHLLDRIEALENAP